MARPAVSQSLGACTPRRHCGYVIFPMNRASSASSKGPFFMCSRPSTRPLFRTSALTKTSYGMFPRASCPTFANTALTCASDRSRTPSANHARLNSAGEHILGRLDASSRSPGRRREVGALSLRSESTRSNASSTAAPSARWCWRVETAAARILRHASSRCAAASGATLEGPSTRLVSASAPDSRGDRLNLPAGLPCISVSHIGGRYSRSLRSRRSSCVHVDKGMGGGNRSVESTVSRIPERRGKIAVSGDGRVSAAPHARRHPCPARARRGQRVATS